MSVKNTMKKSEPANANLELGPLEQNVGYFMRKAVLASQSKFQKESGVKLMTGQYSVMEIIAQNPGKTQSAIAMTAGLDRSSLVPILNQFEKNDLIVREAVESDKRAYAVSLTEKGYQELEALRGQVEEMEAKFIAGLGVRNHQQLITLMKKFLAIL